jgi:hypothetical protein
MEVRVQLHVPAVFWEIMPGIHCIGEWVVCNVGLVAVVEKFLPYWESNSSLPACSQSFYWVFLGSSKSCYNVDKHLTLHLIRQQR